jgi:hypothetical protein
VPNEEMKKLTNEEKGHIDPSTHQHTHMKREHPKAMSPPRDHIIQKMNTQT